MVLPVSVWGTDASGKHFHQLAYTLDISTGGARLAGLSAKLQKGDTIGVRYKQRKAPFRVVWTANNQVGVEYAEAGKFIWIELPESDFVDQEPIGESRVTAEAPPPPSATHDGSQPEPGGNSDPARTAAVAETERRDVLAAKLQEHLESLRNLNVLVDSEGLVTQATQAFHAATAHVRNTGWAVQQAIELREKSTDTSVVIESVNSERVRFLIQLCREMLEEQQDPIGGISDDMRKALVAAVEDLAERLGAAVNVGAPGRSEQSNGGYRDPVALLAGFNDEIRKSSLSPEQTLELIAERAAGFTDADGAAIALLESDELVCRASSGTAPPVGLRFPGSDGLTGEAIVTRQPIICADTENDARVDADRCRSAGLRGSAIVPIMSGDNVTGVLQVFAGWPNTFNSNSISVLERLAEFVSAVEASMRTKSEPR